MTILTFVIKLSERGFRSVFFPVGKETSHDSASRADDCTRAPRPPSTQSVIFRGERRSPPGLAVEPDLVFPPPSELMVDSHGGSRFHVGDLKTPCGELGADKLPCPLAGVSSIVSQLGATIPADG